MTAAGALPMPSASAFAARPILPDDVADAIRQHGMAFFKFAEYVADVAWRSPDKRLRASVATLCRVTRKGPKLVERWHGRLVAIFGLEDDHLAFPFWEAKRQERELHRLASSKGGLKTSVRWQARDLRDRGAAYSAEALWRRNQRIAETAQRLEVVMGQLDHCRALMSGVAAKSYGPGEPGEEAATLAGRLFEVASTVLDLDDGEKRLGGRLEMYLSLRHRAGKLTMTDIVVAMVCGREYFEAEWMPRWATDG